MRRLEKLARIGLSVSMLGSACSPVSAMKRPSSEDDYLSPKILTPTKIPDATLAPSRTPIPRVTDSLWPADPPELYPTETPLVNPYFRTVFNQRCHVWIDGTTYVFDCVEDWAATLLPGGCASPAKGRLSSSTCNSASTAFIINDLVPPEVIQRVLGAPGISPYELVYYIYRYLPENQGFAMTCAGAGVERIRPAFEMFGLKVLDAGNLSWWSLAEKAKLLKPNQRLLLALIGTNAKGRRFQHYTVVNRVVPNDNPRVRLKETVEFYDSFFFADPQYPNLETVRFEDSPNIYDDPNSPIGKRVDIVGAVIVEAADDYSPVITSHPSLADLIADQPDYQENILFSEPGFGLAINSIDLERVYVVEQPIQVGKDRYRVRLAYMGEISDYYFYNPKGSQIPNLNHTITFDFHGELIELLHQSDPRWGGKFVQRLSASGNLVPFGAKACGQTIAASLIGNVDPFNLSENIFPKLKSGSGTFPAEYPAVLENAGYKVEQIKGQLAILRALNEGKLVMIQANVDLGLYGKAESNYVGHYVLALGFDTNGEVIIDDPFWGVGVTKFKDVDLVGPHTAFALSLP